jgi:hypothetical protein
MKKIILDKFYLSDLAADELFSSLIDEGCISQYLLQEADRVKSDLRIADRNGSLGDFLTLSYQEKGCADKIGDYIRDGASAAIREAKWRYCEALCRACDRYLEGRNIADQIRELTENMSEKIADLQGLPDCNQFCKQYISAQGLLNCRFKHMGNANDRRFILRDSNDQESAEVLSKIVSYAGYFDNSSNDNLAIKDGEPIKVYSVSMYDGQDGMFERWIE